MIWVRRRPNEWFFEGLYFFNYVHFFHSFRGKKALFKGKIQIYNETGSFALTLKKALGSDE
jgi:hypothetical protein